LSPFFNNGALSRVSIGKVCAIMLAPATQNSTCLGHLGQHDTDGIVSISCCITQGAQGKYCFVSLSLTVSLKNFANVNNPLSKKLSGPF
jgi:hypothetical protein